jgi:hypothetical protein
MAKTTAALVAAVLVLSGCQVSTSVTLDARPGGKGAVVVRVSFDHAAVEAVGGAAALATQVRDADLQQQGWVVAGPAPGPGSTTVITATHSYNSPAEASELLADVAGSGPAATRPLRIQLSQHHGFWHTDTVVKGTVDLSCGLKCFGDSGLQSVLGSSTGVDPAPLLGQAGETEAQAFPFSFSTRLPGNVHRTNATEVSGNVATWTPRLGQVLAVSAMSRQLNWGSVWLVVIPVAVVVLGLLVLLGRWLLRRRPPRRRRGRHTRSRNGGGAVAVAPHS